MRHDQGPRRDACQARAGSEGCHPPAAGKQLARSPSAAGRGHAAGAQPTGHPRPGPAAACQATSGLQSATPQWDGKPPGAAPPSRRPGARSRRSTDPADRYPPCLPGRNGPEERRSSRHRRAATALTPEAAGFEGGCTALTRSHLRHPPPPARRQWARGKPSLGVPSKLQRPLTSRPSALRGQIGAYLVPPTNHGVDKIDCQPMMTEGGCHPPAT